MQNCCKFWEELLAEHYMITTISFDADGTLWDFTSVMQEALSLTLAELRMLIPNPRVDALTIAELEKTRSTVAKSFEGQRVSHEHIRLKAFEQTLTRLGHHDLKLAVYLTDFYLEHRFSAITLYPDVLPTLTTLKTQYRLSLATNGNSYPERCGLPGIFDFTVFAQDYGVKKPQPQFYQLLLSQVDITSDEIIHVGDFFTQRCIWSPIYWHS